MKINLRSSQPYIAFCLIDIILLHQCMKNPCKVFKQVYLYVFVVYKPKSHTMWFDPNANT